MYCIRFKDALSEVREIRLLSKEIIQSHCYYSADALYSKESEDILVIESRPNQAKDRDFLLGSVRGCQGMVRIGSNEFR